MNPNEIIVPRECLLLGLTLGTIEFHHCNEDDLRGL